MIQSTGTMEERVRQLEATIRQHHTDIQRLWRYARREVYAVGTVAEITTTTSTPTTTTVPTTTSTAPTTTTTCSSCIESTIPVLAWICAGNPQVWQAIQQNYSCNANCVVDDPCFVAALAKHTAGAPCDQGVDFDQVYSCACVPSNKSCRTTTTTPASTTTTCPTCSSGFMDYKCTGGFWGPFASQACPTGCTGGDAPSNPCSPENTIRRVYCQPDNVSCRPTTTTTSTTTTSTTTTSTTTTSTTTTAATTTTTVPTTTTTAATTTTTAAATTTTSATTTTTASAPCGTCRWVCFGSMGSYAWVGDGAFCTAGCGCQAPTAGTCGAGNVGLTTSTNCA